MFDESDVKPDRTLIGWPSSSIREAYEQDVSVVFLDEHGFWVRHQNEVVRRLVRPYVDQFTRRINKPLHSIRTELNWWNPMFTRMMGRAEEYELIRSHSILTIFKLVSTMQDLGIGRTVLFTGVAHHFDTMAICISCEVIGMPQIYFYPSVFEGELIPLVQGRGIWDRQIPKVFLRTTDYSKILDSFLQNKQANFHPKQNQTSTFWKLSYICGLGIVTLRSLLEIYLELKLKLFSGRKNGEISRAWVWNSPYRISGAMKILNNQRRFLHKYRVVTLSTENLRILKTSDHPRILIAAHFQPEATSFPEGGHYSNHVEIALAIRTLGYRDDILYKEHFATSWYSSHIFGPSRVGIYRSESYIDELIEMGCKFVESGVNLSINPNECSWYLPVTIGGTLVIERSLAGLRTIICGEPWFRDIPGAMHISKIQSLESLDNSWVTPDESLAIQAKNFLIQMLENHTLTNYPGIGTGIRGEDSESGDFTTQFDRLIDHIKLEC
jgi:hypothetical protein